MKYEELTTMQQNYVDAMRMHAEDIGIDMTTDTFTRAQLRLVSMKYKGKQWIPNWITHDVSRRAGRGVFMIPEAMTTNTVATGDEFVEDDPCVDMDQQFADEMSMESA